MREIPDYRRLLVEGCKELNSDKTLAGRFLQKSHQLLEGSLPSGIATRRVLEVGAGTGHHYTYVRGDIGQYVLTDGSDGMLDIARRRYSEQIAAGKVLVERQDAAHLTYPDGSFDRLIATHVLEHTPDPVAVLREWNRVVRPGGIISIVLACDPGLLWRFGRTLGPRRNATRAGMPYDYVMAAEHINPIFNLVVFIRHHFEQVIERWYPARVPLPDLNLFYICHTKT